MEDFVISFSNEELETSETLLVVLKSISRLEVNAIDKGHNLHSPFLRAAHNAREKVYQTVDSRFDLEKMQEAVAALEELCDMYIRLVDPSWQN